MPETKFEEERKRIFDDIINRDGNENIYAIKKELRKTMDECAGVYRTGELLKKGISRVKELKDSFKKLRLRINRQFTTQI